jgi:uncharacterized OB-fold protein
MASRAFSAASFDQFLGEHKLAGSRCTACGAAYLPPRAICPACKGEEMEWVELSGRGRLAAFTSIFVGPSAMVAQGYDRNNPYVSGIVALEEGPSVSARILGLDARHPDLSWIGTPMAVEFVDRGEGEKRSTVLAFTAS